MAHVRAFAERVGERHTGRPDALAAARSYAVESFRRTGLIVRELEFQAPGPGGAVTVANVEAERVGDSKPDEVVLFVANYDSMKDSPGADTNASGAAALLSLAARIATWETSTRTIRLLLTTNKEPPHFGQDSMGSVVYARAARAASIKLIATVNVQSVGIYSDAPQSQSYPANLDALFPDVADFVAVVGDFASRDLAATVATAFNDKPSPPPALGVALPRTIPGVDWSDHRSFWLAGYPAVMVSDTALYRSKAYGTARDLPALIDDDRLAGVVQGLEEAARRLADNPLP